MIEYLKEGIRSYGFQPTINGFPIKELFDTDGVAVQRALEIAELAKLENCVISYIYTVGFISFEDLEKVVDRVDIDRGKNNERHIG